MDIKLRNIKYSNITKTIAVILLWFCFLSGFGIGAYTVLNDDVINYENYFETPKFNSQFYRIIHNVVEYRVKLKNEGNIRAINDSERDIIIDMDRYNTIKDRLSKSINFGYYIKNPQTGEVITNIDEKDAVALLQSQYTFAYFAKQDTIFRHHLLRYSTHEIEEMLSGTEYQVYAAVMEPLKEGDKFYVDYTHFSNAKNLLTYLIPILIGIAILALILLIYLIFVAGRREKGGDIVLTPMDRIYSDVHTLLVFIAAIISGGAMIELSRHHLGINGLIGLSIVLTIDYFIGLNYLLSMVRQIKNRQILKNTLVYRIYVTIRAFVELCFNGKIFKVWTLFFLLIYGLINGILLTIAIMPLRYNDILPFLIFGFFLVVFNIGAIYFLAKSLQSLSQIMKAVKEVSVGNLEYGIDNSEITVAFSGFAKDIQKIQQGLKKAVEVAVKGERMKTDLITNVSHDLKTPLTSIINYVDLLKKEDLNNESAVGYINILDEKSARLKKLIEDLVEASKASSGNLMVNKEKVDLHELVMQACGEYEEKIKKSELDIRFTATDKNLFALADGKYMWRILENLMSNTLKYSMPNSRVYINITKSHRYGVLTIKNISSFPLDISPEQLTERFVRGDSSRTTEGSGLGLSIAQSLTTLQDGRFKIEIDGDLFKVVVEVPLWEEEGK